MKQPAETVAIRLDLPKSVHAKLKMSAVYWQVGFKKFLVQVLIERSDALMPKAKGAK